MIAVWMLYALAIGALVAAGGTMLDAVATPLRLPRRAVWIAVSIGTLVLPFALGRSAGESVTPTTPSASRGRAAEPNATRATIVSPRAVSQLAALDRPLIVAWGMASFILWIGGIGAMRRSVRELRAWPTETLDGRDVLVAPHAGPWVVGLVRPRIVVPGWFRDLPVHDRALVLAHEAEHVRARDPLVLAAVAACCALVPWHAGLWFTLRRLRLAIETDCDARVLRTHVDDRRAYGMLLLAIAQRTVRGPLLATTLTESPTHLERRITAMTTPTPSRPARRLRIVGAGVLLAGVVAATAALPHPPTARLATVSDTARVYIEAEVDTPVQPTPESPRPHYPDILKQAGVEGVVLVEFVVDTAGQVDIETVRYLRSAHDLFRIAVEHVLPSMTFTPALIGGHKVKQLAHQPYVFQTAH